MRVASALFIILMATDNGGSVFVVLAPFMLELGVG